MNFKNAFCRTSLCSPSRASLLNGFIELQSDEDGRLWLMVHSGSRGIGPAIGDHHLGQGEDIGGGFRALDATTHQGAKYLGDAA